MKKLVLFGLVAVFTCVSALSAMADELKDAQNSKSAVDKQLNSVTEQKKQEEALKSKLEKDKNYLASVQGKENELYEELVNDKKIIEEELKKLDDSIAAAEEELEEQNELFKTRLRVLYKNSNTSKLEVLIESKSFTDFFEKIKYLSILADRDKELVDNLIVAKKDVEYKRQLTDDSKTQKLSEIEQKEARLGELKEESRSVSEDLRKTQAEIDRLEKLEDQLLAESKDLGKKITELSKRKQYVGGTMEWPLPSSHTVVSQFGMRMHPILKKKKMHTGIDIDGDTGDSIVAANKGTVILSGYTSGYGNRVVIDHGDGITTLYAHCSKLLVKVGDEVEKGQTIAKVGSTGLSTGPHLHFEVREKGEPVDPLKGYLSK